MALRDQPYLPLFVQDFLTDEKLNECSAAATGVYIKVMCLMHKADPYGKIRLRNLPQQNQRQDSDFAELFAAQLVKHLPFAQPEISAALKELLAETVLGLEVGDECFLFQKRMVRDNDLSLKRANSGKKGADKTNQKFAAAKSTANSENEIEYENEDNSGSNTGNNTNSSEGRLKEGGLGETKKSEDSGQHLVPKMQTLWYETIPTYTIDYNQDYPAIVDIYKFIASQSKLKDITNPDTQEKVLGTLQMIALEVSEDAFWRVKPLKSVAKNIQEFYNRIKERKNGKLPPKSARNGHHQPKPSNDDIKASLTRSFTQRGQV